MTREVLDEDLCAECAHCCLLRPMGPFPSSAPGLCVRGWPLTALFWNIVCRCPSFERMAHSPSNTRGAAA